MSVAELSLAVWSMRRLTFRGAHGLSESELLERFARTQDEAAFAEIVRVHGPMVLATCRRVLKHHQDAEDAFQATFLVLARKASTIRTGGALAGWLYQVAFRLAVRAKHDGARHRAVSLDARSEQSGVATDNSLRESVDAALERLPEVYRTPLVLCYLEGRSQDEAARMLATSAAAINGRLKRGREMLRERLLRNGVVVASTAIGSLLAAGAVEAALPAPAIQALTHSALQFAAGSSPAGITAQALALAQGAIPMISAKNKLLAVLAITACILAGTWFAPAFLAGNDHPIPMAEARAEEQQKAPIDAKKKPALSCIIIWMAGGPSQLDTFDPRAKDIALFKSIDTNVKGLQFSETLPKLAKQAHHLAVIRSLTHREGDHARATYLMHTGHAFGNNARIPAVGNVLAKELSADRPELPRFFVINSNPLFGKLSDPGVLGKEYAGIQVGADGQLPAVDAFEAVAKGKGEKLRKSVAAAFDLGTEKQAVRDAYGPGDFGRGCLLARRLVEREVPVIEVVQNGWDAHGDGVAQITRASKEFDAALARLIKDLDELKKLDTTLIVCMGEFGRTPRINALGGRDHYPTAFSVVLAGARIKGGQAIGKVSADGLKIEEQPVTPPELLATIYHSLGIDPAKTNREEGGAIIPLVEKGNLPVKEALR